MRHQKKLNQISDREWDLWLSDFFALIKRKIIVQANDHQLIGDFVVYRKRLQRRSEQTESQKLKNLYDICSSLEDEIRHRKI